MPTLSVICKVLAIFWPSGGAPAVAVPPSSTEGFYCDIDVKGFQRFNRLVISWDSVNAMSADLQAGHRRTPFALRCYAGSMRQPGGVVVMNLKLC
ncbi:uncharacterized protein A4U43_C07F22870 [Asparagus officinalis]|uniref:Secreted protein n=1 Tax=Asparagus officinalis TaxID=4686 RepID=A0A5P1EE47_ASPOF|nr:uncharacterized protein A4U43_C07F22870 [Asparagus officinalis]